MLPSVVPRRFAREELPVLLAVLLLTLPWLSRPFHIDDGAFVRLAQNVLAHPADPFHGSVALDDRDVSVFVAVGRSPNTFEAMSHPPLVPYVLAAAMVVGARSEWALHLAFLVFPLGATVAALSLATFLRSLLYEVAPTSVAEFAGATVLLVAVTLIATLLPARRAARTQPAVVLRGE